MRPYSLLAPSLILFLLLLHPIAVAQKLPPGFPALSPTRPGDDQLAIHTFTFARLQYTSVRREPLGFGWETDFPNAGIGLSRLVAAHTPIRVASDVDSDDPFLVIALLTAPKIRRSPPAPGSELSAFKSSEWRSRRLSSIVGSPVADAKLSDYPLLFMSDAGTAEFAPAEVTNLRGYLLGGGMLFVDDFWGSRAWSNWEYEIGKVLPPDEYPILTLPPGHSILHTYFDIEQILQVPSIQHWYRSNKSTSEMGSESAYPHIRVIFDKRGRVIVLMTHNTDLGDAWEAAFNDDKQEYFQLFGAPFAVPFAINVVVYALNR